MKLIQKNKIQYKLALTLKYDRIGSEINMSKLRR